MTNATRRVLPQSLASVRRRLTLWYAGTFLLILAMLGLGVFNAITRRFDLDLDESLKAATAALGRVQSSRDLASLLDYVRIPDRKLAVLDTLGRPIGGRALPPWASPLARRSWHEKKPIVESHRSAGEHVRAFARPLHALDGHPFIALAMADEVELEDRYASLILQFTAATVIAVMLVVIGGWVVTRQTMAPVERAFDHMRRFMADAAHELRTPISVVRGRAGVALQRDRDTKEYVAALTSIDREAERIGHIVDDLLTLARADAGERPIERKRVFLDDVMLDAVDAARAMAAQKSVSVDVGDYEEAPVTGDAALLRQLALILIDNAIKYTASGGNVWVGVRLSGSRAVLTVRDSGIGITGEQLPHVFERFYRGDAARTRSAETDSLSEGAGLGLSIAQWIAREHSGRVAIESEPGRGTNVTVDLPLARQAAT